MKKPLYKVLYVQVLAAIVIGVLLGFFFPDIGAGNDLGQPLLSEVIDGRKVCAVADHSGADQCNTEFLAHSSFLTYHIKSFKGITLPPL